MFCINFYHQGIKRLKSYNLAGVVYPENEGFSDFLQSEKPFFVQGNLSPGSILKEHPDYLIDFNKFIEKYNLYSFPFYFFKQILE